MTTEYVLPTATPPERCEQCGVGISTFRAETSYHATFTTDSGGERLCGRCCDRVLRDD